MDLARHVLDQVGSRQPACGRTQVVAIDGPSGSGKTTLAGRIAELSGAKVLHLEDLYQGWDGLEAAPVLAAEALAAVAVDHVGYAPTWDWQNHTAGEEVLVRPDDLLIVEGVGSGATVLAPFVSLLVWLDGPADVRRARALARDGSTFEPHWERWAAHERSHFAREGTRMRADVSATI